MWPPSLRRHYPPSQVLLDHPTPRTPSAFLPLRLYGILPNGSRRGASRVAALPLCQTCHGLRPRGSGHLLAIIVDVRGDFHFCNSVVPPKFHFRGSIPSALRLTACLLAALRLKPHVAIRSPRTRYPVACLPSGAGLPPAWFRDLARPHCKGFVSICVGGRLLTAWGLRVIFPPPAPGMGCLTWPEKD